MATKDAQKPAVVPPPASPAGRGRRPLPGRRASSASAVGRESGVSPPKSEDITLEELGRQIRSGTYAAASSSSSARGRAGADPLVGVYKAFCGEEVIMDARAFVRLCKRAELFDASFSAHDARLAFTASMPPQQTRMDLSSFKKALGEIATKKGIDCEALYRMVAALDESTSDGVVGQDSKGVTWSDWSTSAGATGQRQAAAPSAVVGDLRATAGAAAPAPPAPPQDAANRPRSGRPRRPRASSLPSPSREGSDADVAAAAAAGVGSM